MKKDRIKFLYNKRTYLWGILFVLWSWSSIDMYMDAVKNGETYQYIEADILILSICLVSFLINVRRSRKPKNQAKLVEKREMKIQRKLDKKERKHIKKENKKECVQVKKEHKVYNVPDVSNYEEPKKSSGVGKAILTGGFVVGYTGLRVIYSLTKPYMGGKKRRRRRRKRW